MSMFGKFSAAGAAVLCVFSAMAGLLQGLESRGDAVYLKPLGAGEERATQDGTSWATAYATPVDAIAAAGAAGRPVYAAEGVYVVNAQIKLEANFEIYGGFPGLSTDETLADRDIDRHQTVFVGDQTLDDVWIHLEPKRGEANYTSTTLTAKVIADGVVNLPAYTGEFDTYIPSRVNNNTAQCLYINAAVGGRIDGLWIVGFNGGNGSAIGFEGSALPTTVSGCRFVGNFCSGGTIYDGLGNLTIENCKFLFNTTSSRGGGFATRGATVVRNCLFESCSRTGCNGGNVIYIWSGSGTTVEGCEFVRCFGGRCAGWEESNYGGPGNICSAEAGSTTAFTDCIVSNCWSLCPHTLGYGMPLFSLPSNSRLTRCLIENNFYECRPLANRGYTLIGNTFSGNRHFTIDGCVIRKNQILSSLTGAEPGESFALGIVGNQAALGFTVVNTVFDSNVASNACAGVNAVLSRGVLVSATDNGSTAGGGIANCTFTGPKVDGVCEVAQFGLGLSKTMNIVNSIFTVTDAPVANPFSFSVPSLVKIYDSSAKNLIYLPAGPTYDGWGFDPVPFDGYRPKAKLPDIRTTCDLSTNNPAMPVTFAFRPNGATAWQALSPAVNASLTGSVRDPVADMEGAELAFGATTRGALQTLTPAAETGYCLVLRPTPLEAGRLSDDLYVQAVQPGASAVAVTASVYDPALAQFDAWYGTNGVKYADGATLTVNNMASDLILQAKFTTPDVHVTFELGEYGTFDGSGESTFVFTGKYGDTFPSVPAFSDDEDWHVTGWNAAFPDTIPSADVTFTARAVSSGVRDIYVVPGGTGDGTSWENAYGDFATAYEDAAQWRGTVHLRAGVYQLLRNLDLAPNVHVVADTQPIVISGDKAGDTYWKPNNNDPGAANRMLVVGADDVNLPTLDPGPYGYVYPSGNSSDDTPYGFLSSRTVTNAVFEGITFASFYYSAFYCGSDVSLLLRNCRVVGCNTSANSENAAINFKSAGFIDAENCAFIGNVRVLNLSSTRAVTNTFAGCVFSDNHASSYGACIRTTSGAYLNMTNCVFRRNRANSQAWRDTACLTVSGMSSVAPNRITDCLFEDNRLSGDAYGCVCQEGGNSFTIFTRCRFYGNLMNGSYQNTAQGPCLTITAGNYLVRDSIFADNALYMTNRTSSAWGTVIAASSGSATFVNSTFENNLIDAAPDCTIPCGIFGATSGNLSLVNCAVTGSSIAGEQAAEFAYNTTGNPTFSLVNSVVDGAAAGYVPFNVPASIVSTMANSGITGYDKSAMTTGQNGYLYDVTTTCGQLVGRTTVGANGAYARGVAGSSSLVKSARPVWLGSDNYVYFKDETSSPSKPFRRVVDKTAYMTAADALKVGVSDDAASIPDAFGQARTKRRFACGPLRVVQGLVMIVR